MNRQIYNTHIYLFNNCGCEQKKVFKASIIISVACACNAAFNMLHARLCTCRTDYIDMNKPE